jgi:hypothetical protein
MLLWYTKLRTWNWGQTFSLHSYYNSEYDNAKTINFKDVTDEFACVKHESYTLHFELYIKYDIDLCFTLCLNTVNKIRVLSDR